MSKEEKRYDVEKEIARYRVGADRLRSFSKGGKNYKYRINLEVYCGLLREINKNIFSATNRGEFLASCMAELKGVLDDEAYYKKDENKAREALRKEGARLHNNIMEGKEPNKGSVASDKTCFDFLEGVQRRIRKTKKKEVKLIELVEDGTPFYYENTYIYSLVVQIIEIMYSSENYNYIPNSQNYQFRCFQNHLKMVYENVNEIFENEPQILLKWKEILCPLYEMIFNANYPGIEKGDIWQSQCEELRFFDCSYEIAKNYDVYCALKKSLVYDLGDTQDEVQYEMQKYHTFFLKRKKEDEKTLFCNLMLSTLKKIVNAEFDLNVQ